MLLPFFYTLRVLKIPVGTQEWLRLMEALLAGLAASSLQRFYYLARSLLVKSEALYDLYDQAFLICFKEREGDFDIRQELLDWLNRHPGARPPMPEVPQLSLEQLKKSLLKRLKEQTGEHHGGSHWIGTGGTSPFGHSGMHPSGVRLGGAGGGRSALQIAEERRFKNYRQDRTLDTRQFKVALKRLRRLDRLGHVEELNLQKTVDQTCKNAGDVELVFEPEKKNRTELLLLMDVGGSMDPFVNIMEALFSAAHASTHFKAFHHFYFHNCVYSRVFTDMERNESMATDELFKKFRSSFRVIFIGDACMNPYELFNKGGIIDFSQQNKTTGLDWLKRIKQHYGCSIWLNPIVQGYWNHVTIKSIAQVFKMYPLTLQGLTQAVDDLRREDVKVV